MEPHGETRASDQLMRILDLCDRVEELRARLRGLPGGRELVEAELELERSREEMQVALREAEKGRTPGPVAELARSHNLNQSELLVAMILLRRRIVHHSPSLTGRRILSSIFPGSFSVLRGTRLLGSGSRLLRSGVVAVRKRVGHGDVLASSFQLAKEVYRSIVGRFATLPPGPEEPAVAAGYPGSLDYLLDLYRLANLCQRRSNILFDLEGPLIRRRLELPSLRRRILASRERIAHRLLNSTAPPPIERLFTGHGLEEGERLVVAVLFFQDVFYGSPGLAAVDLLRMMSESPRAFVAQRARLAREGRLAGLGIVTVEADDSERDWNGEVTLAPWVSRQILEEAGQARPIDEGARERFRRYLQNLEGSEGFFADLEDGGR